MRKLWIQLYNHQLMKWLIFFALELAPLTLCCRPHMEPEAENLALQRIADFWADGEFSIAKAQMIDFLNTYPQSEDFDTISGALGDLYLRENDYSNALEWYAKVKNSSQETKSKRYRCLYQMGWYSTLIDEIAEYRAQIKDSKLSKEITQLFALSLYQQALNDETKKQEFAQMAKPLFEELSSYDQNEEIVHALSHIHIMLDDFEGAASVYEKLDEERPESSFLLQAALIESKYAPEKALLRFEKILEENKNGASQAAYWWIALSVKANQHEKVVQKADELLELVDKNLLGSAYILVGSSHRFLKQNEQAALFFKKGLAAGGDAEFRKTAMLALAEASYLNDNLAELDETISLIETQNPKDPTLPFWIISKARSLEKLGRLEDALLAIEGLESETANAEKIRLEIKRGNFEAARNASLLYLKENKKLGFRSLLDASLGLAKNSFDGKKIFLEDLKKALEDAEPTAEEAVSWRLLGAVNAYELGQIDEAIKWTLPLLDGKCPDAILLYAMCHQDTPEFISLAEKALQQGACLIKPALQHIALFNACRKVDSASAALHLFEALEEPILEENLQWLCEFAEENFSAEKREKIAAKLCSGKEFCLALEKPFLEWAKAKQDLGKTDEATVIFETIENSYKSAPENLWQYVGETSWHYAMILFQKGSDQLARNLLQDRVQSTCAKSDYFIAKSTLHLARMEKDINIAAPMLRDLILQKNLSNEPLHLEAALDTVDLLGNTKEKKISLLQKMKNEFTNEDDLLSKEYHAARKVSDNKNKIFENYLEFMDAELMLLSDEKTHQEAGAQILNRLQQASLPDPLYTRVASLINRLDPHESTSD